MKSGVRVTTTRGRGGVAVKYDSKIRTKDGGILNEKWMDGGGKKGEKKRDGAGRPPAETSRLWALYFAKNALAGDDDGQNGCDVRVGGGGEGHVNRASVSPSYFYLIILYIFRDLFFFLPFPSGNPRVYYK